MARRGDNPANAARGTQEGGSALSFGKLTHRAPPNGFIVFLVAGALISAMGSANSFFTGLHQATRDYAHASEPERAHVAIRATGLHVETWDFIRAHVTRHDRYVIETPARLGAGFHRFMRTVAGYWLLPSVAVVRETGADVIVYIGRHGPQGSVCRSEPQVVCVLRVSR